MCCDFVVAELLYLLGKTGIKTAGIRPLPPASQRRVRVFLPPCGGAQAGFSFLSSLGFLINIVCIPVTVPIVTTSFLHIAQSTMPRWVWAGSGGGGVRAVGFVVRCLV